MGLLSNLRLSSCWQVSFASKVAFGETQSVTTIDGESIATENGGMPTTTSGGLLAQDSNIGRFESSSHGILQDYSVTVRRYLQCGITANIGYAIHRWVDVQRSGEQIDLSVNPTQIPPGTLMGEARPEFQNRTSDFVVQGLTLGLEYFW
jgi:hypothetical protein